MRRLAFILLLAGCRPTFTTEEFLITTPRILALSATPAESNPGMPIDLVPLVASPEGTIMPALDWSLCTEPKPTTQNNIVADVCLGEDRRGSLARGPQKLRVSIPSTACQLFGPDLPPRIPGEPETRPRDPDATGGYYQPIRLDLDDDATVYLHRVRCALVGASIDSALEYRARYTNNNPPMLLPFDAPTTVARGQRVDLLAAWDDASVETYPYFDVLSQQILDRKEGMRVSWFATAGRFEHARTGVAEDEGERATPNAWTAPSESGVVHVWVVLRDARGAAGWRELDIVVQ